MHLDNTTDPFCLTRKGIEDVGALRYLTRVNTCKGQCAVFVIHDLESKCTEWLFYLDYGEFASLFTFSIHFRLWLHLRWTREEIDDAVEHVLHALILKRRTAVSREEIKVDSALANALLKCVEVGLVTFEVGFHRVVILLDSCFDQHGSVFFDLFDHVGRDFLFLVGKWIASFIPYPRGAGEKVDDTLELAFGANWKHHDERVRTQDIFDLLDDLVEVGSYTIKFVDID